MNGLKGKRVLFVTAPKNFRDEEYFEPKRILSEAGALVVTASVRQGELTGTLGGTTTADVLLDGVRTDDYAAVVFIGGNGAEIYWELPAAHRIAREAAERNKVVGAICIAPVTLAKAGVLRGRKATTFPSTERDLEAGGASCTGTAVERDGTLITANGPKAAVEFGRQILEALSR